VGTLDSRRANAHESGCQIGSPNVASTIVSAHSPPQEICRVSAQAVSGHLKWVMRALRTIQRLCARFVKLSNHATREFDVSLWPAGGRNFSKNVCARRIARLDGAPLRKSATSRSREGMSTTTYVQDPEMQNAWPSNLRTRSRPGLRREQTDRVPVSAPCPFQARLSLWLTLASRGVSPLVTQPRVMARDQGAHAPRSPERSVTLLAGNLNHAHFGMVQEEVTVQGGWGRRPRGPSVVFRSAKARPFAERKATLL
jgi:hypothetical protein